MPNKKPAKHYLSTKDLSKITLPQEASFPAASDGKLKPLTRLDCHSCSSLTLGSHQSLSCHSNGTMALLAQFIHSKPGSFTLVLQVAQELVTLGIFKNGL